MVLLLFCNIWQVNFPFFLMRFSLNWWSPQKDFTVNALSHPVVMQANRASFTCGFSMHIPQRPSSGQYRNCRTLIGSFLDLSWWYNRPFQMNLWDEHLRTIQMVCYNKTERFESLVVMMIFSAKYLDWKMDQNCTFYGYF